MAAKINMIVDADIQIDINKLRSIFATKPVTVIKYVQPRQLRQQKPIVTKPPKVKPPKPLKVVKIKPPKQPKVKLPKIVKPKVAKPPKVVKPPKPIEPPRAVKPTCEAVDFSDVIVGLRNLGIKAKDARILVDTAFTEGYYKGNAEQFFEILVRKAIK